MRDTKADERGKGDADRPLLRELVGDELRRLRREQGRTLADVARHARISMPYLSEVERGRKEASSEVLASVCDALSVDLGALLTEVGRTLLATRAPARAAAPVRTASRDIFCLAA
ncbi:helix-turn-helix domain-containing protein [Actinocorallia sp. API 0066]|uniref:helix-turn-helix domain-containing protein n=1 Tax=Actinocorallia sp. API 0066 TaxID=2896846 RepID=UPI001E44D2B9|nr:helix-turn-helix transcriptional regulator [Actinocorallia sp. API 0066]MCD0450523.1 helix-turn-helix domain-containing protein [Actinocorallia sp. API 0066]